MPQKRIPISKKQHDRLNTLNAAVAASQVEVQRGVDWIMRGVEEDPGPVNAIGTECVDGVYSLVIETADIAPPAEVKSA